MQALSALAVFVSVTICVLVMNRNPEAAIWILGGLWTLVAVVWFYVGYNSRKIIESLGSKAHKAIKGLDNGYRLKSPDQFKKRI